MQKVIQVLKSTVLQKAVTRHKLKMSKKCASDNTSKGLLILPEIK